MKQYYTIGIISYLLLVGLMGCTEAQKAKYPKPPMYPNAQRVTMQKLENGQIRITSFETPDVPDAIRIFYKDALTKAGWTMDRQADDLMAFTYLNGRNNPAFTLAVTVSTMDDGRTVVEVRQAISGPFFWAEP